MARTAKDEVRSGVDLKIVSWNSCCLARTTLEACDNLGADAVLLQELHGDHTTTSQDPACAVAGRFCPSAPTAPEDSAAGCAVLPSERLNKSVVAAGDAGPRMAWVRLKTQVGFATLVSVCILEPPVKVARNTVERQINGDVMMRL